VGTLLPSLLLLLLSRYAVKSNCVTRAFPHFRGGPKDALGTCRVQNRKKRVTW